MNKLVLLSCLVAGSLALTGCQHYQQSAGEGEVVGTVLGGVGGGLLGAAVGSGGGQVIATAAGAILGGLFGHELGHNWSQANGQYANWDQDTTSCQPKKRCAKSCKTSHFKPTTRHYDSFYKATNAEMGHTVYWEDKYSGSYGSVRAIKDGISSKGLYCREFQTTVYVDGRAERLYGTACRMRDGRWMPV